MALVEISFIAKLIFFVSLIVGNSLIDITIVLRENPKSK